MDEVHFQQHGSRCRMWVPPEIKDPVLFHEPTRKSVGYFGAVRLRDGKLLYAREEDKFEAQSCWAFLKQLRQKSLRANRRVVVILDNAKYHHALLHKAWREEALPSFELHFLPPYSPELNPIERVWKLTRRLCLHNVYFPALDELCHAVEQQFDSWSKGSNTLKKLCATT
jgi:DDE superfamily endonuclease